MGCRCEIHSGKSGLMGIDDYEAVRGSCVVLRDILNPDPLWSDIRRVLEAPTWNENDPRWDITMNWNAYHLWRASCLERLTRPLHRYLIDRRGRVHPKLGKKYRAELAERWITLPGAKRRMREFRQHMGKVSELIVAYWLEMGHSHLPGLRSVTTLAALGGPCDITGRGRANDLDTAIEVKFAGMFDEEIDVLVDTVDGDGGSYQLPKAGGEWLLERMFDATDALAEKWDWPRRVAAVAIEEASTYFSFLQEPISAIHEAGFWAGEGSDLASWFGRKKNGAEKLEKLTRTVNELWVFKLGTGLSIDICMVVKAPGTNKASVTVMPGLGANS